MVWEIHHSGRFEKELKKYPKQFKEWLVKIEQQLKENPHVGKPLGIPWFREKKLGKFRIYYILFQEHPAVIMAGISEKKDQQMVISTIRASIEEFKQEVSTRKFWIKENILHYSSYSPFFNVMKAFKKLLK